MYTNYRLCLLGTDNLKAKSPHLVSFSALDEYLNPLEQTNLTLHFFTIDLLNNNSHITFQLACTLAFMSKWDYQPRRPSDRALDFPWAVEQRSHNGSLVAMGKSRNCPGVRK